MRHVAASTISRARLSNFGRANQRCLDALFVSAFIAPLASAFARAQGNDARTRRTHDNSVEPATDSTIRSDLRGRRRRPGRPARRPPKNRRNKFRILLFPIMWRTHSKGIDTRHLPAPFEPRIDDQGPQCNLRSTVSAAPVLRVSDRSYFPENV